MVVAAKSMPRLAVKELQAWYARKGRKPLVLRGARQVGKTTIVRILAEVEALDLFEVNCERYPELGDAFRTNDPQLVLEEVEGLIGRAVASSKRPLLFLDEVQATPDALPWLRYAFEDRPDVAVVVAGSLLEFALEDTQFSMPVGRVEHLWIGPMMFEEFLAALGEEQLVQALRNYKIGKTLASSLHDRLMRRQREFLVVGGMPEAVATYASNQSAADDVRRVQDEILVSYVDDFAKYRGRHPLMRMQRVFRAIPGTLGQKAIYASLSADDRSRDVRDVLELLTNALVAVPVVHSDCVGVPLAASEDPTRFKLLFLDVGLVCRALKLSWNQLLKMDESRLVNEGPLAEQFVGQELLYRGGFLRERPHLNYWLRHKRGSEAEIDYVLAFGTSIMPIEVKAGATGKLRSLHQMLLTSAASRNPIRFWGGGPSQDRVSHAVVGPEGTRNVEYLLTSLPLYLSGQINRLAPSLLFKDE